MYSKKIKKGPTPTIDVIIPYKHDNDSEDRYINLNITIDHLIKYINGKIIIVEQDSETLTTKFKNIKNIQIIHCKSTDSKSKIFEKARCFNIGFEYVQSDYVLGNDCDIIIQPKIIEDIINETLSINTLYLPYDDVYYTTKKERDEIYTKGVLNKNGGNYNKNNTRKLLGGAFICKTSNYLKVGGMCEKFRGWGSEDNEFFYRCSKIIGVRRPEDKVEALHLYHIQENDKYYSNQNRNSNLYYRIIYSGDREFLSHANQCIKDLKTTIHYNRKEG